MLSVLQYSFNAVMPIILMILVGVLARRTGFLDAPVLGKLSRFTFRFGFTAMMFVNIYDVESIRQMPVKMGLFCVAALVILLLCGIVLSGIFTKERFRRGVLIQSMFRSNYAIIGLPVAIALVGDEGGQMASFLQLPVVTFFNFTSVLVLSIFSDYEAQYRLYGEGPLAQAAQLESPAQAARKQPDHSPKNREEIPALDKSSAEILPEKALSAAAAEKPAVDVRKIFRKILTNPLIQGLFLGMIALIFRQYMPVRADGEILFSIKRDLPWLYSAVKSLGQLATPLALIVLGGQLEMKEIRGYKKELAAGVLMRLAGAPAIGFSLLFLAVHAGWLSVGRVEIAVLTALFASPQAVASIVMSSEMGGDGHLAGQIVVWSSVLGMVSLFMIVFILRSFGLL